MTIKNRKFKDGDFVREKAPTKNNRRLYRVRGNSPAYYIVFSNNDDFNLAKYEKDSCFEIVDFFETDIIDDGA